MGRAPCCDKANVKKGPWSPEEDLQLKEYIEKYGTGGNWIALPQKAGLRRCGKSCRLRWLNYLRPNIKHGEFSAEEDRIICTLFATIGSRWSIIAAQLPGRTDNDIKNYWNTKLKKRLLGLVSSTPQLRRPQSLQTSSHQSASFQPLSSLNNTFNPTTNTYMNFCQLPSISFPFNCCSTAISSGLVTNPFESQGSLAGSTDQFYNVNHLTVDHQGSCSLEQLDEKLLMQHSNNNYSNGFGKEVIDYDLEDIKELISSSNSGSSSLLMYEEEGNKLREGEEKYYD